MPTEVVEDRAYWMQCARRHGFDLQPGQFRGDLASGYTIDGMDAGEWIEAVCGCYEDGGTLDKHVD